MKENIVIVKEKLEKALAVMLEEESEARRNYLLSSKLLEKSSDDVEEKLVECTRDYFAGKMVAAALARELLENILKEE